MASNNLIEMSRSLRLYCPQLPITLAQQFIRDRYRQILERRDWSGSVKEAEFLLYPAKSDGAISVIKGANTVAGIATTFAASDVNRQFKAGQGSPVYTITAVDAVFQTLTLDRPFGAPTAITSTYYIMDAYVSPPAGFMRFINVTNPVNGWKLRHWITGSELDVADPQRTYFGQPYLLADRLYNLQHTPQYEAWPYAVTNQDIYYTYVSRPPDLINDSDVPIWPIRSDIIVLGALAHVAMWPGTANQPNPYFARPSYWQGYEAQFEDRMIEMERVDEDVYSTQITYQDNNYPLYPISASWIQSHV